MPKSGAERSGHLLQGLLLGTSQNAAALRQRVVEEEGSKGVERGTLESLAQWVPWPTQGGGLRGMRVHLGVQAAPGTHVLAPRATAAPSTG